MFLREKVIFQNLHESERCGLVSNESDENNNKPDYVENTYIVEKKGDMNFILFSMGLVNLNMSNMMTLIITMQGITM